jgi:uncharacterized membrane protein YfcA
MTIPQFLEAMGLGLAAGVIGGLAGIGGSLVMLPGLALVFGYHTRGHTEQHVYQAAAMAINLLVAIPATRRHVKAGAMRPGLVWPLMPPMIVAIIAGVLASDRVGGRALTLLLAAFIGVYCCLNLYRAWRPIPEAARKPERAGLLLLAAIGAGAGFIGGLLGLGGGAVMVPALQLLAGVRLRAAIAASSAAMVASSLVGACLKFMTLPRHGHSWDQAALLVLAMAPGAILGGGFGAHLAHHLPLRVVRIAISVILLLVAARLVFK